MNSTEIIKLLQESPLFRKVKSSTLASLLMRTEPINLLAERVLLTPGEHNDRIYVVLSGRLRVQLNPYDTEPLALMGAGECVGEMSMFDDAPVSAYVIAAANCELLPITHTDVWALLNESLPASHNMLNILARRMQSSNRKLAESMGQSHGFAALDYIDAVTGIYNSRWLVENAQRLVYRYTVSHQPCFFMLLRMDNFRQFDAQSGSHGAELAQRTLARTMQHCLRPNDLMAHVSADQFAVFLLQAGKEIVERVGNRLLEEIARQPIVAPGGEVLPRIVLTVGSCEIRSGDRLGDLVERAQATMRGV